MAEKILIGRNDKIDLPKLDLYDLDAKIDTGAFTSAIHYHHAEIVEKDGRRILHFTLLDPTHPDYNGKSFYFDQFEEREIKNSFGDSETRFIIITVIHLFGKDFETEFSLSNRGNLKFPILLGRKLLKKGFVVDVAHHNLSFKSKQKKNKIS
ncbi:ATP-dependent zinc protease family protein [Fulvivirga sediminis]|uniref:ATP-dependent zinc protease n=1 Tax=Fulvivirga sediminis TaxID=2803949 RepID=A0A937F8Z8_9BACT|nr:RimK/LysX family protein [Fulvivirga sediminis]MBL3656178.1 ATP-dependent zinc protease [Fulvivirga sediminis]